ncbi:MAG: T9SS type A sorting domain-containing protein [Bacteroidales bacterium]
MKKRLTFAIAGMVAVIAIAFFLVDAMRLSEREKYEKFLLASYAQMPEISQEDMENTSKMDRPDLAAMQNYYMIMDPELKRVPTGRLKEAYLKKEKILQEYSSHRSSIQWDPKGANMGGRTRAIMYDPNDPDHEKIWAGAVTGGLWYNNDITDPLNAWVPVGDFWDNLSISCIVYDPNDPLTFYAGTGEAETAVTIYRESSGVGMGIMKSDDGGQTWDLMPSTEDFKYVTDIAIRDENGTTVIYAAVVSGIYHGVVHQSGPSDGLFRSEDHGQSWEQVLPDIPGTDTPYPVSDIEISSGGNIFVGTMQNVNLDGGGVIFYSGQGTPGTWTKYDDVYNTITGNSYYNIPGRVVLASAPSDPDRVYALFSVGYDNGFIYYNGKYIVRTDDGGQSWIDLPLPADDYATLSWHALTAGVDPNDPDHVYVGGLDVWKSENAGMSWNHLSDWAMMYYGGGPDYIHADQHIGMFRDGSSDEMVFTTDGGVFYTEEGSSLDPDFEEKNHGFNTLQFYTCAMHPGEGEDKYIGGLQDNGTLYYNGAPLDINDMIDGGDGAYCFWDKDQPFYFITSVYYNRYTIFSNGSPVNDAGTYSGTFICPADYDWKENTIYANACSFFGSNADRILRISNLPYNPNEAFIPLNTGTFVPFSHIKYSEYSAQGQATVFVGSQSGRLFRVDNAQANPSVEDITGSNFPVGNISCIAIGDSEDELLVTFSNYGVMQVFQSADGGQTWLEKQGNLPDMPVRWAIYHPENSQQAMLATEIGVWSTNSLHLEEPSWEPAVDGLANVRTDMLKLRESDNTVLAATHGRGLFTAVFEYDPYVGMSEVSREDFKIYPNPGKGVYTLHYENSGSRDMVMEMYDASGKLIRQETIDKGEVYDRVIDISSRPKGIYFVKIGNAEMTMTRKVIFE